MDTETKLDLESGLQSVNMLAKADGRQGHFLSSVVLPSPPIRQNTKLGVGMPLFCAVELFLPSREPYGHSLRNWHTNARA